MGAVCSASFSALLMYRYVERYELQIIHTLYSSTPSIWYYTYIFIHQQNIKIKSADIANKPELLTPALSGKIHLHTSEIWRIRAIILPVVMR